LWDDAAGAVGGLADDFVAPNLRPFSFGWGAATEADDNVCGVGRRPSLVEASESAGDDDVGNGIGGEEASTGLSGLVISYSRS
jgi:hypothetical protein